MASTLLILALAPSLHAVTASGQEEERPGEVRVAQERTNVHQGEATYHVVLVQVPEGTVFPVVGQAGEWYEVELSPDLRDDEDVTVIRWYEGEETGWVHQSWVELVDEEVPALAAGRSLRQAIGRRLLDRFPAPVPAKGPMRPSSRRS